MTNNKSNEEKQIHNVTQGFGLTTEQKLRYAVEIIEGLTYTREEVSEAMNLSSMRVSALVRNGSIPPSTIITVYGRKYYSKKGIGECIKARQAKADARRKLAEVRREEQLANAERRKERRAELEALAESDRAWKSARAASKAQTQTKIAVTKFKVPEGTQETLPSLDELLK